MPPVIQNGTPSPRAISMAAPEKKVGGTGGGKGRPSQGKMFPRGTGK